MLLRRSYIVYHVCPGIMGLFLNNYIIFPLCLWHKGECWSQIRFYRHGSLVYWTFQCYLKSDRKESMQNKNLNPADIRIDHLEGAKSWKNNNQKQILYHINLKKWQ